MLKKEVKSKIIEDMKLSEKDTGSVEVQVALLTKKIDTLTDHLKENKQDKHSKRGLLKMVASRKSLLRYLMKKDVNRYKALIEKLGLRK